MFSKFSYHIAYQPVNNFVIANFMFLEETFFNLDSIQLL
jgi:hypothetical protein